MASPLRLSDLATASGAARLQRAIGYSDEDTARALIYARKYLKDNPDIHNLRIGLGSSSYFDHDHDRIALSSPDPEVLAHELGHASDLGLGQGFYKNFVTPSSKMLNHLIDRVSLLGGTAIATGLETEVASKYLNRATLLAAATAAPTLYNEAVATHKAAVASGNYIKTLTKLSPGLISHTLDVLSPVAKLQAIKHLKDLPPDQKTVASAMFTPM